MREPSLPIAYFDLIGGNSSDKLGVEPTALAGMWLLERLRRKARAAG